MEAAAAAERCGVDLNTYTTLLELQHRDITPEDYDTLQLLDSSTKPKTLNQSILDAKFPAWTVPEGGGVPAPSATSECAPRASRSLEHAMRAAAGEEGSGGAVVALGPSDAAAGTNEMAGSGEKEVGAASAGVAEAGDASGDSAALGSSAGAADSLLGAGGLSTVGLLCEPAETSPREAPTRAHAPPWDMERTCSICLEKFLPGQLVRSLPCSHVFHQDCIDSWLTKSSRACPEDQIPVLGEVEMAALDAEEAEQQRRIEQHEQQRHEQAAASLALAGGAAGYLDALGLGGAATGVLDEGYPEEYLYRLEEAYARAAAEDALQPGVDGLLNAAATS